jgi:hypothetical protein
VIFLLSPRATSGAPATFRSSRPAAALVRLVRFAYLLDTEDRRELSRVFDSLAAVVRAVPVVHLRVRHGHRRLEEVAEAVRRYGAALPRP